MPETRERDGSVRRYHHIGGEQVASALGEWFDSHNPTTRETLYAAARGDAQDVDRAVTAARRTFEDPRWRDLSQTKRGHLLHGLGDLLAENAEDLALTETLDTGCAKCAVRWPGCRSTTSISPGWPTRSRATSSPPPPAPC